LSTRNYDQRRKTILSLLAEFGEVSVEELSAGFAISAVTIRKDLSVLEKDGLLLRKFGGAIALPKLEEQEQQASPLSPSKQAIAEAAARLVNDRQRIVLDSGSTTATLVPYLDQKSDLVVMTNSLAHANSLQGLKTAPRILVTGGNWDPRSNSLQGQIAENALRAYDFDYLFIGASGLDISRGTTTFNEHVGLSRVMAEVSKKVVVMAEADKFNRKIPNVELPWHQIDILVTNQGIEDEFKQRLTALNVKLVCA
jgi:DeoR/GlpR family transcriptional regulator of sugar metabolism